MRAALVRMVALMAVVGAVAWWRGHRAVVVFLACFAAANVLAAAFVPRLFHGHARLWEKLGAGAGLLIGGVLLALAYYLFFTPAALLLRLLGKDPLALRFPGSGPTYWSDVPQRDLTEAHYKRQF